MKKTVRSSTTGSALVVSLSTVLVLSIVGAGVLANLTTRYNVSTSQVRAWKQALHAAEAAGDIAYAAVRRVALEGSEQKAFIGWTKNGNTYTSPATTMGPDNLVLSATVDRLPYDDPTGNAWYRIRAKGTAPVQGLKRTGMNDRMDSKTRGDSVLRKIDLNYDHFIAAYGPNGDGTGKAIVPVPYPQVTRRIELIAAPITPFEAAIKASGTFYGLGSAARIDSYDSSKDYNDGRPQGSYFFVANNPSDPRFSDSRSGHVQIGTAVATIMGTLYGNIATNGGTIVRSEYITGTIDNNVPFSLPPYRMPDLGIAHQSPANVTGVVNLTPTSPGTAAAPNFYTLSSYNGDLTIHPAAGASKTHVALKVQTTITGSIRVKPGVHAQVFFESDLRVKAQELINETGYAGNLQFYGVSPTNGSQQRIEISPPGNFSAVIYAPSAEYMMNGNPDITGALVCKTFYGNGNTSWHYDRALDYLGEVTDYRITSYVEDIR